MEDQAKKTMKIPDNATQNEIGTIILKAETERLVIDRPYNEATVKTVRKLIHILIAERLIRARNKTALNNDKINRLMLEGYVELGRNTKSWTFTNAVSSKMSYLPDKGEVIMLSEILGVSSNSIGPHLIIAPWLLDYQKEQNERPERRKKAPAKPSANESIQDHKIVRDDGEAPQAVMSVPMNAGDIKISHSEKGIFVNGKIWCNNEVAERLKMIVPLNLIQQAKFNDPWCYEVKGQIHDYQLYNLMHVLYGSPRVLSVEMPG